MRKLILALAVIFVGQHVKAVDLVYTDFVGRKGRVVNSNFILRSTEATVITPAADFCELQFSTSNALWYYRNDNTTTTVTTDGMAVAVGERATVRSIAGNKVSIQAVSGASTQTIRMILFEPK